MNEICVCRVGREEFGQVWAWQEALRERRREGQIPDILLLVEHPATYTCGRATPPEHLLSEELDVVPIDRGGSVTFHGPGQLVAYPIFKWDLEDEANVKRITAKLEQWTISALAILGILAGTDERMQGVWVEGSKVGSVGLAFKRWVSRHGFTVNYATPKGRVETLDGCGLIAGTTTSLDRLGYEISGDELIEALLSNMPENLSRTDAKS